MTTLSDLIARTEGATGPDMSDRAEWPPTPRSVNRFWGFVKVGGPDQCWPWTKARTKANYGRWCSRRRWMSHRFAWAVTHGRMPTRWQYVCHRCDNPPCCNPAHLFLGSAADNSADCWAKGRASPPPRSIRLGSAKKLAKLKEDDVVEIRRRRDAGETVRGLAQEYGVDPMTVSRAVRRLIWSHVP